ncbi:TlpA disulfide reductase family protein [Algibacter pacificus]|uniref:TlpA disulfide reductase family protein n=1 Tax=Algibacter pacificus TaxID=2599389 RepID=UPI00164F39D6|nr:TlpA disulfide reductase family protein [Algibacter pacificus]
MKNSFTIIPLLIFTLITVSSCNNTEEKDKQIIKGTISGLENNPVVLMDDKFFPLDTVQATNNSFVFEHKLDINNPKMQGVYLPQLANKPGDLKGKRNKAYFFIDSKNINIKGEILDDNLLNVKVIGSPITKAYKNLEANFPASIEMEKYAERYSQAFKLYNDIEQSEENLKNLKYYSHIIDSLNVVKGQNIVDAINTNSESIALSYIAYNRFKRKSPEFLKNLVNKFAPSIKDSHYISLLNKQIELKENSSIGAMAPDFELANHVNKNIKLSDFKGAYVLIDFWASWCGPCKREIPYLKQAHEKFKDKGLKIVSVSLDSTKEAWLKSLEEENLPYIKLWDEKLKTKDLYQYLGIPWTVLVNPEGRIVKLNKGLRGEDLEKTLKKLIQ